MIPASDTSPDRDRVVDFVRAGALGLVVLGHWAMQGVIVGADGVVRRDGLLSIAPWTHPFTWLLQVMSVFFLVGGYANARSWRHARDRGESYGVWLSARVRRLTTPLVPLMVFWLVVGPTAHLAGLGEDWLRVASRASLVPTWFLAVYLVVVACVPATLAAWERWGARTLVVGLAGAALVDLVSISQSLPWLGAANLFLVWALPHQLGYAWLDGAVEGLLRPLLLAGAGFVAAVVLVRAGPYGVSMVGVDGFGLDNTRPPRVTLALLGLWQAGILLALRPWLNRLLARPLPWAATVLAGRRIMTVYVWHLTALGVLVAGSVLAGGVGLRAEPGTAAWWWGRPAWFAVLAVVTGLAVLAFGRFEDRGKRPVAGARAGVVGAELATWVVCLGAMSYFGVVTDDGGFRWYLTVLPLLGHLLLHLAPVPDSSGGRVAAPRTALAP